MKPCMNKDIDWGSVSNIEINVYLDINILLKDCT
jgi:hypothetical protein